jgi:hypothetical protein
LEGQISGCEEGGFGVCVPAEIDPPAKVTVSADALREELARSAAGTITIVPGYTQLSAESTKSSPSAPDLEHHPHHHPQIPIKNPHRSPTSRNVSERTVLPLHLPKPHPTNPNNPLILLFQ